LLGGSPFVGGLRYDLLADYDSGISRIDPSPFVGHQRSCVLLSRRRLPVGLVSGTSEIRRAATIGLLLYMTCP
jgi:hypothetical protein